jgi:hypothetical protein
MDPRVTAAETLLAPLGGGLDGGVDLVEMGAIGHGANRTGPVGLLPGRRAAVDACRVNRSAINLRMTAVLVGALIVAVLLVPSEFGHLLQQFRDVALEAGHRVHDGYMRLF